MNIGILIIAIVGGATGLLSTAYLAISFPAVLLWKLYRRVVHRIPLTQSANYKHFPSKKDPEAFARVPCRIFLFYFYSCTGSQFSSTSVAVTAIPSDAFSARITR